MALKDGDLFLVNRDDKSYRMAATALAAYVGGGGASVHVGVDAPDGTPSQGDLWWKSDVGILYVYYVDDNTEQWVQAAGGAGGGGGGGGSSVTISEDAPSNAAQGDLWWNTEDGRLYVYYTDNDSSQWVDASPAGEGSGGGGGSSVTVGDAPPTNPSLGDLWWNSDDGRLYVYYSDNDSSQWVDASPDSATSDSLWALDGTTIQPKADTHDVQIGSATTNILLNTDGTASFTPSGDGVNIDSDGRLLVGTTSATASQLLVTGSISANGSDGNFSADGNRAFMDVTPGTARMGACHGGGAAMALDFFAGGSTRVGGFSNAGIFDANAQQSLTGNGFTRLPSGIIIQWGQNSANNPGITANFPLAFPNTCWAIVASLNNQVDAVEARVVSTSQFNLHVNAGTPQTHWIAIGN